MTSSASQLVSAVSELPSSGQSLDAVAPPILPKTRMNEWMEGSIDRFDRLGIPPMMDGQQKEKSGTERRSSLLFRPSPKSEQLSLTGYWINNPRHCSSS